MQGALLRLTASPPLGVTVIDELRRAAASLGRLIVALTDQDVGATTLTVAIDPQRISELTGALARPLAGEVAPGQAHRFEILAEDDALLPTPQANDLAGTLGEGLRAPAYVGRRTVAAAAWALARPMPWGRKGLALGRVAPVRAHPQSRCLGVALEVGRPTVVVKVRLVGVPEHGLSAACRAVGGVESGFAEVGAYGVISSLDDTSVVLLEFSNVSRSPIHRALDVIDIECRRWGGRLGSCLLLSHVPLEALLGSLSARIGLEARSSQVLETHLGAKDAQRAGEVVESPR